MTWHGMTHVGRAERGIIIFLTEAAEPSSSSTIEAPFFFFTTAPFFFIPRITPAVCHDPRIDVRATTPARDSIVLLFPLNCREMLQ
jgi:hypothetical protein